MSAPRTDIEKQKKRHIWPIAAMIIIVLVVLVGFVVWISDESDDPIMPGEDTTTPVQPAEPQTN